MFGLEILDVVIGLMFVYLLLALLASALNEYVSTLLNLRGKELARGLGRLLENVDEKQGLKRAFDGVGSKVTTTADSLTERFYNHPLIRPLATRRGRFFRRTIKEPRLPSYIPARTFAQALLDVMEIHDHEAKGVGAPPTAGNGANPPAGTSTDVPADRRAELARVLAILKRESPLDVNEHLRDLNGLLGNADLPPQVKLRLVDALTGTQTQLQKLHDSVEVWFNNSMDRVSGAYKRTVQGWLFALGLGIALVLNADTVQMWRTLSTNDRVRDAMAERAGRLLPELQPRVDSLRQNPAPANQPQNPPSVPAQTDTGSRPAAEITTANPGSAPVQLARGATPTDSGSVSVADSLRRDSIAWARFERTQAHLDSMELKLGWSVEEGVRVGILRPDAPAPRLAKYEWVRDFRRWLARVERGWIPAGHHLDLFPFDTPAIWGKLFGLMLTAVAISLGAPFWFDLLNKVISIRATGRSPEEKPKSPQGAPKRAAEDTPK